MLVSSRNLVPVLAPVCVVVAFLVVAACGGSSPSTTASTAVTVQSVEPSRGPVAGGTLIAVRGTNFGSTANVAFGDGVFASVVVVQDDTLITCFAPPGVSGETVDVTVTTRAETAVLPAAYTYLRPATITGIDPTNGPVEGGTPMTITGSGFQVPGLIVSVGERSATAVNVVSDTFLTCLSPVSNVRGPVPVTIRTDGGTAVQAGGFTFLATLEVEEVLPATGFATGGDIVRVRGAGFQHLAGTNTVTFGAATAPTATVIDDDHVRCTTPAGTAGSSVEVTVTNDRGVASRADVYQYFTYPPLFLASNARLGHDTAGRAGSFPSDMACSGANVYVVWTDNRHGSGDIFFTRSTDGGVTWLDEELRLNVTPAGTAAAADPKLWCEGTTVCVVWSDQRNGNGDVFFRRSADAGETWSSEVRMDRDLPGVSDSIHPVITGEGPLLFVAWRDTREGATSILFNRSLDAGVVWLPAEVRVSDDLGGTPHSPRIDCVGENVQVVWVEPAASGPTAHVRFDRSQNAGASWLTSDVTLDAPGGAAITSPPRLLAEGSNVHVVWCDGRSGKGDVYFTRSTDGGVTWLSTNRRLDSDTAGSGLSRDPSLAVDGSDVYVVWSDERGGVGRTDIHLNRSTDGGSTWLFSDFRVSGGNPGDRVRGVSRVACSAGNVYVVWEEARFSAVKEIIFRCSSDRGATWLPSDLRLNDDATGVAEHVLHGLCAEGARVYVSWFDTRNVADVTRGDMYATVTRP
jgi:hypothetical protein